MMECVRCGPPTDAAAFRGLSLRVEMIYDAEATIVLAQCLSE